MIKINLLPFRAARKKENIKKQITVFVLAVFLLLVVVFYLFLQLNGSLNSLEKKETALKAELKEYEETLARIKELDQKTKTIRAKLDVIKRLEKAKTGPVHLLDEIAMAVPRDALWLSSFSETKGILTLKGTAMDNETVARFMTNLEKSSYIKDVDLKRAQRRAVPQYQLNVSDFVLNCKTYAYVEKKPAKPVRKKRRKR